MQVTTFKPKSLDKYKRSHNDSQKIPNVTMVTERLANMLICEHCNKNWNEHAGVPTDRVNAGMCLTESNFRLTNTYLIV